MKTIDEILLSFFDRDEVEKIIASELAADDAASAWYVKALIGLSGWFASISFLASAGIFFDRNMETAGMLIGLFLVVASAALNNLLSGRIFVQQFALSLGLAGLAIATYFFGDIVHSTAKTCVFSLALNIAVIAAYRYAPMRFMAIQAAVISILVLMYDVRWAGGPSFLIMLLAMIVFVMWIYEPDFAAAPWAPVSRALSYGLTFSLLALPALSTHNFLPKGMHTWYPATAGVAIVFVAAQMKMLSSFGRGIASPAFIAGALLTAGFAAISWNSPGLIVALYVTALGFFRGNRIVTAMAGLCLGGYIIMFYYNLSLTLLVKSYILMGSGALLVAAWAALVKFRGGDAK